MKPFIYSLSFAVLFLTASMNVTFAGDKHSDKHDSHTHAAHVHGEANLFVVQEGSKVQIEFMSPAFNIIGFEYMPKTEEEKQKLGNALVQLEKSADLFDLKSGDCLLTASNLDNPFSVEKAKRKGHRDFRVSYEYECRNIDKLKEMKVNFLSTFHGIENFIVQWVVNNKQGSVTLSDKKSLVEF